MASDDRWRTRADAQRAPSGAGIVIRFSCCICLASSNPRGRRLVFHQGGRRWACAACAEKRAQAKARAAA